MCPVALGSPPWFIEPCLAADAGVLLASGVPGPAVVDPTDSARAFGAVLGLVRVGALISGWLLLEAQGELAVPFVAYRYGFGDPPIEPKVFVVPRVGVSMRGAVGFRFR